MANIMVAGDLYESITGQLFEIGRQLRQQSGYPFDPERLKHHLQAAIEGRFKGLLRLVHADVSVDATQRFVANDRLGAANIGWTNDAFKRLFLNKVEANVPAAKLSVHCLEEDSLDSPILAELGDKAEIFLAYFFQLLEKQSKGQAGRLLTNGYANIAYIRDAEGILWAVDASWDVGDRYWSVDASSVGSPGGWFRGYQVISQVS